jgi:hypothetical protein
MKPFWIRTLDFQTGAVHFSAAALGMVPDGRDNPRRGGSGPPASRITATRRTACLMTGRHERAGAGHRGGPDEVAGEQGAGLGAEHGRRCLGAAHLPHQSVVNRLSTSDGLTACGRAAGRVIGTGLHSGDRLSTSGARHRMGGPIRLREDPARRGSARHQSIAAVEGPVYDRSSIEASRPDASGLVARALGETARRRGRGRLEGMRCCNKFTVMPTPTSRGERRS